MRELIATAMQLQFDAKPSDLQYEIEEINVIGRGARFVAELLLCMWTLSDNTTISQIIGHII